MDVLKACEVITGSKKTSWQLTLWQLAIGNRQLIGQIKDEEGSVTHFEIWMLYFDAEFKKSRPNEDSRGFKYHKGTAVTFTTKCLVLLLILISKA
jgi:hypothetical protein